MDCRDAVMVVSLAGEIDHHNAIALRMGIDKAMYENRPQRVVLDLKRIRFMDSSGLGLIMGRYSLASKLGASFSLRDPTPGILKIFRLAGLERTIAIESTKSR